MSGHTIELSSNYPFAGDEGSFTGEIGGTKVTIKTADPQTACALLFNLEAGMEVGAFPGLRTVAFEAIDEANSKKCPLSVQF